MNPIAMVFVLIGLAIMAPLGVHYLNYQSRQTMATVAALQMSRIQKAAEGYITTYASQIEGQATASSPVTISIPMLVNTGYLPNGFQANNPYGQTWEVQVLQPSAGQLQALVLSTGGPAVDTRSLGLAAQIAGAPGGVVGGGSGSTAVPGCSAGQACGVYAGWKVPTANTAAAPGHLAALIEYSNGQVQNDYLYRVAVPGQPQLNQMQTNLDMGNNNINNANEVNAQSETLAGGTPNGQEGSLQIGSNYFYGDSTNAAVRTPGGFYVQNQNASGPASINEVNNIQASGNITTPNTVQGGYVNSTGNVNAQNALTVNGGSAGWINNQGNGAVAGTFTANALGANYIWSNGNINAGGQVNANYDATLGTAGGSANIGRGCSPNGAIAANANGSGQILSCQGGTWQAMGGNDQPLQMYSEDLPSGQYFPGLWQFCAVTDGYAALVDIYPASGPYTDGTYQWATGAGQNGYSTVFTCYNLPGVYIPGNP